MQTLLAWLQPKWYVIVEQLIFLIQVVCVCVCRKNLTQIIVKPKCSSKMWQWVHANLALDAHLRRNLVFSGHDSICWCVRQVTVKHWWSCKPCGYAQKNKAPKWQIRLAVFWLAESLADFVAVEFIIFAIGVSLVFPLFCHSGRKSRSSSGTRKRLLRTCSAPSLRFVSKRPRHSSL